MATKSRSLESRPEISEGQPGNEGGEKMKICQNCGFNQELCGVHDCHNTEPKTVENGECSGWEPDLPTMKKAWETTYKRGCPKTTQINCLGLDKPCIQCKMDYAMKQAIEGG